MARKIEIVIQRIGVGWKTFNSMSSMLCGKKTHGKSRQVYRTCMRSIMTYGLKTWVKESIKKAEK